jgi:ATP-dependent helicase HrpB
MSLPIDEVLGELRAALRKGHALLQAPTGSGKSTRVPLALLDEDWLGDQRILMLEPRRPAARMTAARMAAMLGERLGETVGYLVRFDRRISPHTRIEVLTEGILTRRLQTDPGLEGVGAILFDELHEMNLQSELGLALTLDTVDSLRPDLRILAMSATLDGGPVSALLGDAPIVRGGGRAFPVEISYAERAPDRDPVRAVISTVRRALAEHTGDVLAFLPGAGEIGRCLERLDPLQAQGVEILPLHGSLPGKQQDHALMPGGGRQRRVILATDIAETSVTIQGIGVVIDSGLTRKPRFEPGTGLTRLVTEPVSLASAEQRAGRAGRLGPGFCYRLWTKEQERGRPEHRTPEILQSDLAPLALQLALWGIRDPTDLKWIHNPPRPAVEQARHLLRELGALNETGNLTERGRAMAELPVHPRLAAMLIGAAPSARALAADLCALISERDPMIQRLGAGRSADLGLRLQRLEGFRSGRSGRDMDHRRIATTDRVAEQLSKLSAESASRAFGRAESPGALLASAYPDRVARRRGGHFDGRYLLANGSGAILPADDALSVHPYLVIADMDASGRDGRIYYALPIDESELRQLFAERISSDRELSWDRQREAAAARQVTRLGALVLAAHPAPLDSSDNLTRLLTERIGQDVEDALGWTEEAHQLQARVALMRGQEPGGDWPDLSTRHLADTLQEWLGPWLVGKSRLAEVRQIDPVSILKSRLDWGQLQRLDLEAPARFTTPAGNRHRIDYASGEVPAVAVPLQEMLGAREQPAICNGRVRLLLHLLSPARRPIQVTRDLAGFWSGSYAEVRKEMRGRYPKHRWPDDPANAAPMSRSSKRKS